ncbi:glycosyltransferase family 2 protein, partial [Candidatus Bathyarchaeota archaeon]|nr:glycosyltransferase family 2 protein [Candidatus Bathyarchaeota archaeon]
DTVFCFQMTPSISIILPTLNEERGIIETLKRINKLDLDKEVLVVDGLSTDNTVKNAEAYGARIIIEERKGKGVAMATGVKSAKSDIICFLDGDGTYPPRFIPKMLELIKNCDVVVASRLLKKEGANDCMNTFIHYRFFPFIFKSFLKKFKTSEPITGMRLMRKETWNKLNLRSHDFMIETEMEVKMAKNKMKVIEIPIPCIKRIGRSKWDSSWGTLLKIRNYVKRHEKYLKDLVVIRYTHV